MGRKVCMRCKGKTLLGLVNKLLTTKSLFARMWKMCFKERIQNATTFLYVDLQFKALLLCRCALKSESMSPGIPETGVPRVSQASPGRWVYPIPIRGDRVCPPFTTGTPKFFHLPASLNSLRSESFNLLLPFFVNIYDWMADIHNGFRSILKSHLNRYTAK